MDDPELLDVLKSYEGRVVRLWTERADFLRCTLLKVTDTHLHVLAHPNDQLKEIPVDEFIKMSTYEI